MEPDVSEDFRDDKKEKLYRKISIWTALILSTVITIAFGVMNPPDSAEVQKMRLFFKENGHAVTKFLRMTRQEKEAYAEKKKHLFYSSYIKAPEKEKQEISALIHVSMDYTPNQYWFNVVFVWAIGFASFWFMGVMLEGTIILMRKDKAKRLAERDAEKRDS